MIEIICAIISVIIALLYFTADLWSRWLWPPPAANHRAARPQDHLPPDDQKA
jgi:hypothetical protein